jgi:hypothetical protein
MMASRTLPAQAAAIGRLTIAERHAGRLEAAVARGISLDARGLPEPVVQPGGGLAYPGVVRYIVAGRDPAPLPPAEDGVAYRAEVLDLPLYDRLVAAGRIGPAAFGAR